MTVVKRPLKLRLGSRSEIRQMIQRLRIHRLSATSRRPLRALLETARGEISLRKYQCLRKKSLSIRRFARRKDLKKIPNLAAAELLMKESKKTSARLSHIQLRTRSQSARVNHQIMQMLLSTSHPRKLSWKKAKNYPRQKVAKNPPRLQHTCDKPSRIARVDFSQLLLLQRAKVGQELASNPCLSPTRAKSQSLDLISNFNRRLRVSLNKELTSQVCYSSQKLQNALAKRMQALLVQSRSYVLLLVNLSKLDQSKYSNLDSHVILISRLNLATDLHLQRICSDCSQLQSHLANSTTSNDSLWSQQITKMLICMVYWAK